MNRLLSYALVGVIGFFVGKQYHLPKAYETLVKDNQWYLKTSQGVLPIFPNDQVGTIHYRMAGLLDEPKQVLQDNLELIIQESRRTSRTAGRD